MDSSLEIPVSETSDMSDERAPRDARGDRALRVRALGDALAPNELARLGTEEFVAFLAPKRWFGAKAGKPTSVRVRDAILLPWESGRFAIVRLDVATEGSSEPKTYQVPLCVRSVDEIGDKAPKSVLARVATDDDEGLLFDAVEDGAFLRALADAVGRGGSYGTGKSRWVIETFSAAPLIVPPSVEIRVGSAEQSNTSVILGEQGILKLFRKLEQGENPDVELTRFLTIEAEFPHTPSLLGVVRFEDGGTPTVGGMLQEFLPKSADAWSYALECARPYFKAPKERDAPNTFLPDAEQLGVVTRALHEALATGTGADLAPEPADASRVDQWAGRARQWVRDGLALLDRQLQAHKLPKERASEAEALVRRADRYFGLIEEIVNSIRGDTGLAIRIHGDYHLGQVLRTARDDFMIIDFEGEPARALAERREKTSPLRDVAGMLRSFAYAAATLGMEAKSLDLGTRELRVGRWERDTREAFMRGYLEQTKRESRILPSDPEHTRALLRLFETEKAFYELAYELNNRPDWTWIPMRGIAKLLA
jgi:maltose alpha-D-glucosyltransferase/alpha-amylase